MALGMRLCSTTFYSFALLTYKPPEDDTETRGENKNQSIRYESKNEMVDVSLTKLTKLENVD